MKRPLAQGHQQFDKLPGNTAEAWRGIVKEDSPGAIPDNSFQDIKNVRFSEDALIPRGGQSKLTGSALSGTLITGIFDDSSVSSEHDGIGGMGLSGERIFYGIGVAPTPITGSGDGIFFGTRTDFDGSSQPPYAQFLVGNGPIWNGITITDATIWNGGSSWGLTGNGVFALSGGKLYHAMVPVGGAGGTANIVIGRIDDNVVPIATETTINLGVTPDIASYLSYNPDTAQWYLAISTSLGVKTYWASTLTGSWTQFGGVLLIAAGQVPGLGSYGGDIVQWQAAGILNSIGFHYYTVGTGDGGSDWTRIDAAKAAPGKSFPGSHYFQDKLYLVSIMSGGGSALWRYDGGATLTNVATISAADTFSSVDRNIMWEFNGLLYIVGQDVAGGGNAVLHSWDGSTFVSTVHNFGVAHSSRMILITADNNLCLGDGSADYYLSSGTDVTSWTFHTEASGNFPGVVPYGAGYPFQRRR